MGEFEARPPDAVMAFLRELRRSARESAAQLQSLNESQAAANRRVFEPHNGAGRPGEIDLASEVAFRDAELKATADELGEQLDSLRRAAALLERERSKYLDLFEHAPEPYIVTNLAGVIDEANIAAGALFRTEPGFLAGRPLITFIARGDTRAFRAFLGELQTVDPGHARTPRDVTLRMRPRGQPVFVVFARATPVIGGSGKPVALRWMLRQFDPDEVRTANGEAVADLALALVEDLRGPLLPITAWARSLREGETRDESEARQALDWIERSAQTQQSKLDELTEFAKAYRERGGPEETAITEDVDRAVRAAGGEWSRVAVERDPDPDAARVSGRGLARALELLLQRALDGTPRHDRVTVRVQAQAYEVVIEIEAPEPASVPAGWAVRTATAMRLVERCGGRLVMSDTSPSVRLSLPRLSG
jgi:signal transduction histidine kinase